MDVWAQEFRDIPATLAVRPDLRAAMHRLLDQHELPVKVTEGGDRRAQRRAILGALFDGALTLDQAVAETETRLARETSPHRTSNLVFATGWARSVDPLKVRRLIMIARMSTSARAPPR